MKDLDAKSPAQALAESLEDFHPDAGSEVPVTIQKAVFLARAMQARARDLQTPPEKRQQAELDRLMQHAEDKATLIQITDQAFRSHSARRVVDQFIHILDVQGIPRFFSAMERTMLKGFQSFGGFLPGVAVPLVKERMQKETANVILPAEGRWLADHLRKRSQQGIRMNVNILGEAILSEQEAARRLEDYLERLRWPEIEVVSVKISTLYSQISPLARRHTIAVLGERLEGLFREASRLKFRRNDGSEVSKLVYLDMEAYQDLHLTAEAFMQTLERPGLESVRAGIALQAYIPDSYVVQKRLNGWARKRVAYGGAPITLRVVKGANMEMERVEASLAGWLQAPFKTKAETDANFKRMLREAFRPENLAAVRLGVASHNLFDVALALVLAHDGRAFDHVQFEMLEGMANHQRRALQEWNDNLLLYSPVCRQEDFVHAIGYLIRRLDENTGPDNFLRYAFKLEPGSDVWRRLEKAFIDSFDLVDKLPETTRHTQSRWHESAKEAQGETAQSKEGFHNEADTDFALPVHSDWAEALVEKWSTRRDGAAAEIPLVIDDREIFENRPTKECFDPSRPGLRVGRYRQAHQEDIDKAVATAVRDQDGWRELPFDERSEILCAVASEIRRARADLIGAAMANGGKTISESDPEVSEAVDFIEFYRRNARSFHELPGLKTRGKGVVVVVSPWNFPIAIPCGGIAAALAAGNTVILKPASDTVLVAWELCQCFWRAGVSRRTLQFTPCAGGTEGAHLACHPEVDIVILTGGTDTARTLLRSRPDLELLAETGGKNATVVTALADRDLAIKHVLHSAFSHSGQKCSATSLLLLEAEVFEDPEFKTTLCDAAASLPVGSAWDPTTKVGPLIRPPSGDLKTGLESLEPGESWALQPRRIGDNPRLWSPGIKWNVRPGGFTHLTELFGPVLGVMPFRNLGEAIDLVNQTGYGLTSGLESLDDREQAEWSEGIRAGNLYINRPTTGAIVLRQPFGGMGKSAFGPGLKVGGPNYLTQLMNFEILPNPPEAGSLNIRDGQMDELLRMLEMECLVGRSTPPETWRRLRSTMAGYEQAWDSEFSKTHDHFRLIGQDNLRRYRTVKHGRIRIHKRDDAFDILARIAAARVAGCRVTVSFASGVHDPMTLALEAVTESWGGAIELVEESDDELVEVIRHHRTDRLRYAARDRVPMKVWAAAAETGLHIAASPVHEAARLELLNYLEEQSISHNYHRYGNLGRRAAETRTEPD